MPASLMSMTTLGNWRKDMAVKMSDVINVSMDVMGKNGEDACSQAIATMRHSASAMTTQAKTKRPVMNDARLPVPGGEYVDTYKRHQSEPTRLYRMNFLGRNVITAKLQGTWEDAQKIARAGLAKASWFWGGDRKRGSKPARFRRISGATKFQTIISDKVCGYIFQNKLDYIQKALPSGWEATVQERAGNRIMANAAMKLGREWMRAVGQKGRITGRDAYAYFKQVVD